MLPLCLDFGLWWSPVDLAHPADTPGPPACFLCSSCYCPGCSLGQPPEASGRPRGISCSLRRPSGGFGPPSGTSCTLRRPFGGFGRFRGISCTLRRGILFVFGVARQAGGAGGLPLRQAPRGRCLASSRLKPRLNPGGSRHTVPFSLAKRFG